MFGLKGLVGRSEVLSPIMTLGVGALASVLIPFGMSFVLSRLYAPGDFGDLGVFINYAGILIVVASGRYDIAIVRARGEREALSLSVLSVCISAAFCLLLWVTGFVSDLLPSNYVSGIPYKHVLPAFVFLSAGYQVLLYLLNYHERYRSITASNVAKNVIQAVSRVLLALFPRSGGLVWGALAGVAGGCALALRFVRDARLRMVTRKSMSRAARRYLNFPKFVLPSALLNSMSTNLPLILLALFYDRGEVGYFTMTTTMLYLPVTLLASTIGQVFYKKSSIWEAGKTREFAWGILRFCGLLSATGFAVVMLGGRPLFGFLLGEEWRAIGDYAATLVPWFMFVVCFSPLSMIFDAKDKQQTEMFLNIGAFAGRNGAILAGGALMLTAQQSVLLYCLASVAVWVVEGFIILRIIGMQRRRTAWFMSFMFGMLCIWGAVVWFKYF